MKVRAPAKLILSGEHAIVHGLPALAMAVNRYAEAEASAQRFPLVSFEFTDLAFSQALRYAALDRLKEELKEKYRRFLKGEYKIRRVLQKPMELAQFASSLFFEILNIRPTQGVKIKLHSDIPIGCGMGSSAAIILAVIHAIAHHLKIALSPEMLLRLGIETENLQHGHSSGLDLRVSQQGGCLFIDNQQTVVRPIPAFPFYLVNTGTPQSTTGECVSAVAPFFNESSFCQAFRAVTEQMNQALDSQDQQQFCQAIRSNHRLLVELGVVPATVQNFISAVEAAGCAAKICGAGAIRGEQGGIVLVITPEVKPLIELCGRYHYALLPIAAETRGVHVI